MKKHTGLVPKAFANVEDTTPTLFGPSKVGLKESQECNGVIRDVDYNNPFLELKEVPILKEIAIDKSKLISKPIDLDSAGIEIIKGVIPSKSNCYIIITLKSKDPGKKNHSSLAKSPELKTYEKSFAFQCRKYKNLMIDFDFVLNVDVYYPSRRADLDNSLKILLDCLQKMVFAVKNDNLCVEINAKRKVDKLNPRIEFAIAKAV